MEAACPAAGHFAAGLSVRAKLICCPALISGGFCRVALGCSGDQEQWHQKELCDLGEVHDAKQRKEVEIGRAHV